MHIGLPMNVTIRSKFIYLWRHLFTTGTLFLAYINFGYATSHEFSANKKREIKTFKVICFLIGWDLVRCCMILADFMFVITTLFTTHKSSKVKDKALIWKQFLHEHFSSVIRKKFALAIDTWTTGSRFLVRIQQQSLEQSTCFKGHIVGDSSIYTNYSEKCICVFVVKRQKLAIRLKTYIDDVAVT